MMNWPSFERTGISHRSPLVKKLWRIACILNKPNPFDEEILNLNPATIDLIFKLYADDHPNEFKLDFGEVERGETTSQVFLSWSEKLTGQTKDDFDRNPIAYLRKHYGWGRD